MNTLHLQPYTEDTKANLEKVIAKLSHSGINFREFLNFVQSDVCKKVVLLVGGNQISGSLSPLIHTYSSFSQGKPFIYTLFNVLKEGTDLQDILENIAKNDDILGANVTMPYKVDVYKTLHAEGRLDTSAILVGAVNTIAKENGGIKGYNTDMYGILRPIQERLSGNFGDIKKFFVLGSGGAARAAIAALLKGGAQDITIFNRSLDRMVDLVNHFSSEEVRDILREDGNTDFSIKMVEYDVGKDEKYQIGNFLDGQPALIINTLPFGFKTHMAEFPIRESEFTRTLQDTRLFFDVVYDLEHECTPMIARTNKDFPHVQICDGFDMLVEQAKKGFEMWTGGASLDEKGIKEMLKSLGSSQLQ